MSALIGAVVFTVFALIVVVIDLLRAHGRILRTLHAIDPADGDRTEATDSARG